MRNLFLTMMMVVCCLLAPASSQESTTLEGPGGLIERMTLPNGMTVLLQSVPDLPAVAVALAVPVGSAHDPQARPGTCQLLAQLQSRSPGPYPMGSLLLSLEEIGARSGYRVLPRWTVFHEVVPRQHLEWFLNVEMERLKPGRWSTEEIDRQQILVQEDWRMRGATLAGAQERLLLARLQGATLAEPQPVPPTELQQFALQYWNPPLNAKNGPVLAIVGGFSSKTVREKLLAYKASAAPGAVSEPAPGRLSEPLPQPGGQEVQWLFPLPSTAEEMAVLTLLDATLRDIQGLTTRLDLVENTYLVSTRLAGLGAAECEKELSERLKRPVLALMDPAQLKVAQSVALRRFYRHFDSLEQRAQQLALDQGQTGLERLTRYPEMLRSLQASTIASLAPQLLDSRKAARLLPEVGTFEPLPLASRVTVLEVPSGQPPRLGPSPEALSKPLAPPGFTRLELDRGVTVLVQTIQDLPTITVRGYLAGGLSLDSAALAGRSQLVARALDERVRNHPRWSDSALELRFSPQAQFLGIEGWMPREALGDWLSIFVAALSPQPLNEGQLDLARSRTLLQLGSELTQSDLQAYQRWLQLLYTDEHPLGRDARTLQESARRLTLPQVNEHLTAVCRPNRLTLALSGDVTASEVAQRLTPLLASLAPPDAQLAPPAANALRNQEAPPLLRLKGNTNQALILTGGLAPSRKDADYYAFSLLTHILGGESVTSRLQVRLRDKEQLATVTQARFLAGNGPMPFLISLKVRPGKVNEALNAVQEEVERLRTQPVHEAELKRAVSNLEGQLQVSQSSSPGRALLLRNVELFHLSDGYAAGFAGLYRNLTPKDLLEVAKRRLQPQSFCTVVVEP